MHAVPDGLLTSAAAYGPMLDSCGVGPPSVRPWTSAVELAIDPRRATMLLNFRFAVSFYPLDIAIQEWHHRNRRAILGLLGWSGGLLPCSRLRYLALSLSWSSTCLLGFKLYLQTKGTQQLDWKKVYGLIPRPLHQSRPNQRRRSTPVGPVMDRLRYPGRG